MTEKNFSFFTHHSGSGIWYVIHTLALHAKNDRAKKSYILTINTLAEHFGCEKCKTHFKKFIEERPLRNYWNVNYLHYENIGFFKWTWELHNDINKILDKKLITLEDALLYYVNGICKHCEDKDVEKDAEKTKKYVNKILVPVDNNDNTFNLVSR